MELGLPLNPHPSWRGASSTLQVLPEATPRRGPREKPDLMDMAARLLDVQVQGRPAHPQQHTMREERPSAFWSYRLPERKSCLATVEKIQRGTMFLKL